MRRAAILAAIVLACVVGAVPAGAEPDPATLAFEDDQAAFPRKVLTEPEDFDEQVFLTARLAGDDLPDQVSVTVAGDGVTADPSSWTLDTAEERQVRFEVTAEPGLHRLVVTATAEGAEPATLELDVWAPGGEPLPATGDLTGRLLFWDGTWLVDDRHAGWEQTLLFLDDRHVFTAMPDQGLPDCAAPDPPSGCEPYYYDAMSGLVQIGDRAIGRVRPHGVWVDGLGPPNVWDDPPYWGQRDFRQAVGVYRAGIRISGSWLFRGDEFAGLSGSDLMRERLTLGRTGTYTWRRFFHGEPHRVIRTGRYRVLPDGVIRLSSAKGPQLLTFLPCLDQDGVSYPDRCLVFRDHVLRAD